MEKKKKSLKKRLLHIAGILLGFGILIFMLRECIANWESIRPYLSKMSVTGFVFSVIAYAIAFLATGYNWSYLLWRMDPTVSRKEYMNIHMTSALARYLPGGIWNIVGKAVMCTKKGVEKSATTASMILEYVFQILSSGLFLLFFLPVLMEHYLTPWLTAGFLACVLLIIFLLPWAVRLGTKILLTMFKEKLRGIELKNSYVYHILVRYILVWLWTGIGLILLVCAFTQIDGLQSLYLMLSYPVSWVIGFLSPSPNGMGVREGVLSILLGKRYDYKLLLLVTLTTRIWTIFGEIIAFLGFKLYYVLGNRTGDKKETKEAKQVLFITTKNLDYLRNTQEIRCLKEAGFLVDVIGSHSKQYKKRLFFVWWKLLCANLNRYQMCFVGFAPQLIVPFFEWKLKGKMKRGEESTSFERKLIIDFFISIYDTLVFDRKKIKKGSMAAKFLRRWDTKTILSADKVICDTDEHGKYFVREFGLNPKKLETLYLEADRSIYHPMEQKRRAKCDGKFSVLYFGSILPLQGVDIVLKSAEILTADREDIRFIIIGPIKKEDRIENKLIHYIEWLSQKELAEEIAEADLCLAGHFNGEIDKAKRTIPGKAYIYQAMKKPMILGENPANHELFFEREDIYFVEMGNPEALAEKIVFVKAKKEEKTDEVDHTDTLL